MGLCQKAYRSHMCGGQNRPQTVGSDAVHPVCTCGVIHRIPHRLRASDSPKPPPLRVWVIMFIGRDVFTKDKNSLPDSLTAQSIHCQSGVSTRELFLFLQETTTTNIKASTRKARKNAQAQWSSCLKEILSPSKQPASDTQVVIFCKWQKTRDLKFIDLNIWKGIVQSYHLSDTKLFFHPASV